MARYFIHLAYNGAPFHGWQSQPNAVSVQETIEKAMAIILRGEVKITGAGRTDTGVNARSMFAHFDVDNKIADTRRFIMALNSLVGKDIAIYSVKEVSDDAHARFDATARTYKYFIGLQKSPFDYNFCWTPPFSLDVEAMNVAASHLFDYTDFTSFSKLHTDVLTNNCKIMYAKWEMEGEQLVFTIKADRFLRNMVRAIVGTLVDVGRGKLQLTVFARLLKAKTVAPLEHQCQEMLFFLWKVDYPYPVG